MTKSVKTQLAFGDSPRNRSSLGMSIHHPYLWPGSGNWPQWQQNLAAIFTGEVGGLCLQILWLQVASSFLNLYGQSDGCDVILSNITQENIDTFKFWQPRIICIYIYIYIFTVYIYTIFSCFFLCTCRWLSSYPKEEFFPLKMQLFWIKHQPIATN